MAATHDHVADDGASILGHERELGNVGVAAAQVVHDLRLAVYPEGCGLDGADRDLVACAFRTDHAAAARGGSAASSSRNRRDSSRSRRGPPSTTPSSVKIARAAASRAASGFFHSAVNQACSSR